MTSQLQSGKFKVTTVNGKFTVSTESGLVDMSPAEADLARSAIGTVVKMSKFKALPPKIAFPPFEVTFSEDPNEDRILCELKRVNTLAGCKFTFNEGDDLLHAIALGTQKVIDELRISGGARAGVSSFGNQPDPIIEGKG